VSSSGHYHTALGRVDSRCWMNCYIC